MKEAIEVLQNEIGVIRTHIRKMARLTDECQIDLVKDWPKKVAVLELAIKRLLKQEVANDSASTNCKRDGILQALARGYCSLKNKNKVLDPDLIEAMADELEKLSPVS